MDEFLRELQDTFLLESQDLIANVESLFLQLEKDTGDVEIYNQLARLAHNFKGSGKAVGFEHISHFSHQLENLLLALKALEIQPTPSIINLLFRSVDALKVDLDGLRNQNPPMDYTDLYNQIAEVLKLKNAGDSTHKNVNTDIQPTEIKPEVSHDVMAQALAQFNPFTDNIQSILQNQNLNTSVTASSPDTSVLTNQIESLFAPAPLPIEPVSSAVNLEKTSNPDSNFLNEPKIGEIKIDHLVSPFEDPKLEVKPASPSAPVSTQNAEVKQTAKPATPAPKAANSNAKPSKDQKSTAAIEYLRIPAHRIETLINSFGEQVILQSTLDQAKGDLVNQQDVVMKTITQLSKLTYDLQQTAMSLRMLNLNLLFSKLERAARDAAQVLNKPIQFVTKGQENELDKTLVDALSDALTHMIRNAVDHGIETPDERKSVGKNPGGQIQLLAFRTGGSFVIEIRDDGKGLDPAKIFAKAVKVGIIKEDAKLTESEIFDLIFENGFSTKEVATDLSGRGVGMNVVKESVAALKGSIEIESKVGFGTTFRIRLPLTLAIFNGMIVRVGDDRYIIPSSDVEEVCRISKKSAQHSSGKQKLIELRGLVYSLVDLGVRLGKEEVGGRNDQVTALLVKKDRQTFAILVDEVMSIQKIVHKPVGEDVRTVPGTAGASILGDGSVCLILNIMQYAPKVGENSVQNQEAA